MTAGTSARTEPRGFWDSLGDWFLPDEDRSAYAEGLRRGGYLLSVDASDSQYERVIDILDDEGTIDLDERAESWRSEGWSGSSTADVLSGSTANLTTGEAGTTSGIDRALPIRRAQYRRLGPARAPVASDTTTAERPRVRKR